MMNRFSCVLTMVVATLSASSDHTAWAQKDPAKDVVKEGVPPLETPAPKPVDPAALAKEITQMLAGTEADYKEGIARAEKILATEPAKYTSTSARAWLKALLDAGRFEAAESLALKTILAAPSESTTVEACQAVRVRALLGLNKPDEALANAKSLLNVSSLATTSAAILTVAECLNAAHPGDVHVVKQFRLEQIAGAKIPEPASTQPAPLPTTTSPTEKPTAESAQNCPTLLQVKIDGKVYEEAFKKIIGEDYLSLVAKGNLLLLADRIKDAREMFERAYGVGADSNLVTATENLARVIKAEDGTIGRANAWIISLRPAPANTAKPNKPK